MLLPQHMSVDGTELSNRLIEDMQHLPANTEGLKATARKVLGCCVCRSAKADLMTHMLCLQQLTAGHKLSL